MSDRRDDALDDLSQDAHAILAAIVESSDDAIVGKTLDGIVLSWNRAAERIFGYTAAEMIGQPIARLVPPERLDDLPGILRAVRSGERVDHFETERVRKDGRRVHVSLTVSPIRDASGRVVGASKIARDVSARRRADAEREELLRVAQKARVAAENADRAKDQFLAMLAHELRNPLGALRNAILVAQRDGARSARALEIAVRQANSLGRLIDDLLDVARFTRGQIKLQRAVVAVASVVDRALETTRPQVEEGRHTVSVAVEPADLEIDADPARLEQLLENLLGNAAKYTPPGGSIAVTAERNGDEVCIAVRDSGVGLEPDMLARVFDLFAQADRGLDRRQGGLGIGLTVVRRIAELHGGRVEARSAGLGTGAEFLVRLPAGSLARPEPPVSELELAPAASGDGADILLIEDNVDAADSLKLLLELYGHHVRVAHDGETGIRMAERAAPDLLLIDIGLPNLDGYRIAERLREHPTLSGVLRTALTGYGRVEDRERALAAGFHHHLVKPADPEKIDALARGTRG